MTKPITADHIDFDGNVKTGDVTLHITDARGKQHAVTIPAALFEQLFNVAMAFIPEHLIQLRDQAADTKYPTEALPPALITAVSTFAVDGTNDGGLLMTVVTPAPQHLELLFDADQRAALRTHLATLAGRAS